jgi:hypothetical protein
MSTELDVEALVAAGDTEALMKALNAATDGGDLEALEESTEEDEQLEDENTEKTEEKTEEAIQQTGEAEKAPAASGETEEPFILTADGKRAIPIAVLQGTRKKLSETDKALQEALQRNAELEQKLNGQNPEVMTLEEMAELDPRLAAAYKAQQDRIDKLEAKTEAVVDPEAYEAGRVFESSPELGDLRNWSKENPERWELAKSLDDILKTDPAYKSVEQRFIEVQRLVKIEFGDVATSPKNVLEKAQQIVAEQQKNVKPPTTLSATSATQSSAERSKQEQMLDKSADDIVRDFESMTPQQREQFLAGFILT